MHTETHRNYASVTALYSPVYLVGLLNVTISIYRTIYRIMRVNFSFHTINDLSLQHTFLVNMINTTNITVTNKTMMIICPK